MSAVIPIPTLAGVRPPASAAYIPSRPQIASILAAAGVLAIAAVVPSHEPHQYTATTVERTKFYMTVGCAGGSLHLITPCPLHNLPLSETPGPQGPDSKKYENGFQGP